VTCFFFDIIMIVITGLS